YDSIGWFIDVKYQEEKQIEELLEFFDLTPYRNQKLHTLPLGKQRLAMLARTIIKNPPLLVLDEPCQGLDTDQAQYFNDVVDELAHFGKTLIYVGHYESQLPTCIEHRIVLENGEVKAIEHIVETVEQTMKKNILIIPADGIGQEVTIWGKQVLAAIAEKYNHGIVFDEAIMGHTAIEATGNPLPDETLEKAKASDAILFGAIGHAKYDNDPSAKVRPEQGLLKIRKELGLYANLRPILLFDELLDASSLKPEVLRGTDILFFRELTGDVYFGEKNRN